MTERCKFINSQPNKEEKIYEKKKTKNKPNTHSHYNESDGKKQPTN